MKLLVTGGAGFVGRHVCAAARAAGHAVDAMTRSPETADALGDDVGRVRGDLTDADSLRAAVDTSAPDVVIHAAAVVVDGDPDLEAINVAGTHSLCAVLTERRPSTRLVHVSTFAVEDIPPTAYSDAKLAGETVVRESGLPFVVVRPTLVYGRGDSTNTPALVERMRVGTHWLPAGGRTRIQPVHVEDVAAALVAAAERPDVEGKTYRLGGPEPVSVREYREAVREATGGAATVRALPLALFGPAARVLAMVGRKGPLGALHFHLADHAVDIRDAVRDLGFAPRSLKQGLKDTFDPV